MINCQRCGTDVPSYSPMRKWCVDCRRLVSLEQAKTRKEIRRDDTSFTTVLPKND